MHNSAYRPLARRFRPKDFSSVVGQEVPLAVLKNSLTAKRLPHAVMFHGMHGTGKTTLARILSKTINCMAPSSPFEPCNTCESCQCIDTDTHPDVREVDAASRTGVDDIREMLESLPYQPILSQTKVYIIDEVHMLSKSAFNALLKNLEEPPDHVKFVFATTELYKVPATTLSRCLVLDLSPISADTLKKHLAFVAQSENISISEDALELLAQYSCGSARDALMALEKTHLFSQNSNITEDIVQKTIGIVSIGTASTLLDNLLNGKNQKARDFVQSLYAKGADPKTLLQTLQKSLYLKICTLAQKSQDDENRETSLPFLLFVWQVLLRAQKDIALSETPQQALDIALLRFHDLNILQEESRSMPLPEHGQRAVSIVNAIKKAFPEAEIQLSNHEEPHG